jgi:hypothetical protein
VQRPACSCSCDCCNSRGSGEGSAGQLQHAWHGKERYDSNTDKLDPAAGGLWVAGLHPRWHFMLLLCGRAAKTTVVSLHRSSHTIYNTLPNIYHLPATSSQHTTPHTRN